MHVSTQEINANYLILNYLMTYIFFLGTMRVSTQAINAKYLSLNYAKKTAINKQIYG